MSSPISIPLAAQLPLIARPGTDYSFSFSPLSFGSDPSLTYSATNLPSWASFDASTLTISGTPGDSDVTSTSVTLSASSSSGQVGEDTFTLLVSSQKAPEIGTSLAKQFSPETVSSSHSISSAYAIPPSSSSTEAPGLRIPPQWSFSIGLQPSTFTSPSGSSLFFSALSASGAPLPSWLQFSNTTLTFTGITPSTDGLVSPWEIEVDLVGSDVWGFAGVRETFRLVLSQWEMDLPASAGGGVVNMTMGEPVQLDLQQALGELVMLNGVPIGGGNISSVALLDTASSGSLPSWLSISGSPPTLSGTPPSSGSGSQLTIPVNITSTLPTPSLLTNLTLALFPSYFSDASLPAITAHQGTSLSYPLGAWMSNASIPDAQVNATFTPSSMSDWLSFSAASGSVPTLSGTPPKNINYAGGNITLLAYSPSSGTTSHTTVNLLIAPPSSTSSTSNSSSDSGISPGARIALIILGIIALILLLCLCLFCFLRRTQKGQRVRKSLIGKAYVIDTDGALSAEKGLGLGGSPDSLEAKGQGLGFMSPLSPEVKVSVVDEMGAFAPSSNDADVGGSPYVPHPKHLPAPSPFPQSSSDRSISPPALAAQGPKGKKEAWWTRVGSATGLGSLASRTGSIKKWQISKPIARISRHISGGVSPHPGMGQPAGRGILIRVPEAPARAMNRDEVQSVRFVQPRLPEGESWTPPPSLAPVGGLGMGEAAEYGYAGYEGYGYAYPSPPPPVPARAEGRGSNPFMHARDSNPFRRESYSGFAPSLGADPLATATGTEQSVSGSGSGGSTGLSSSEGYGSSEGYLGGHQHSGSVESERPVRRRDFAPPGNGRAIGTVDENDEDEDGEEEEEETDVEGEAVISRAELVSNHSHSTGSHGTPKRPRLVDFTSERKSDEVTTLNRLESQKAVAGTVAEQGGLRYIGGGGGGKMGVTPRVGEAVIYDGFAR